MSNIPTIEELLRDAKRAGASDVHITVGIPPKMRVNGQLLRSCRFRACNAT